MNQPTNSQMLDWCAIYVTNINSLADNRRGTPVELIAQDGRKDMVIVRRTHKDIKVAFRTALIAAMKQRPGWK